MRDKIATLVTILLAVVFIVGGNRVTASEAASYSPFSRLISGTCLGLTGFVILGLPALALCERLISPPGQGQGGATCPKCGGHIGSYSHTSNVGPRSPTVFKGTQCTKCGARGISQKIGGD